MEYYVPLNGRCRNKSREFYKLLRPHKKCVSFQSGLCLLCHNKRPSEDVKRHFVAHYPTTNKLFCGLWNLYYKTVSYRGCRHSSVDLFAPSNLPPRVQIPSTPFSLFFNLNLNLNCSMLKRQK